ncbi:hypothetical protein HMPREF3291_22490 [Bacillus sp. HMSC76G11]|nr:hypothetical protein HMPREF3291_22490 [Bacillus sp. HMSC76G11]
MAKLLNVQSKLEGQGVFVVENATTLKSGANGLRVNGTVELTNLVADFKLIVDGKEVLNVNANGVHPFQFTTQRRMDSEEVAVAYEGTADVVLDLEV